MALAVFAATTVVIVEFNAAICALAVSIAVCTVAVFGSGIGVNGAPCTITPLNPGPGFVS